MGPVTTDDPLLFNTVEQWLREAGDLLVDLYYPRMGADGSQYLLRSTQDLERLVAGARPDAVVTILRDQQYPLRGIVDEDFIARIQSMINKHVPYEPYEMVPAVYFPEELHRLAWSGSHNQTQFLDGLRNYLGEAVLVGKEVEFPEIYWEPNPASNVLIARKTTLEGENTP